MKATALQKRKIFSPCGLECQYLASMFPDYVVTQKSFDPAVAWGTRVFYSRFSKFITYINSQMISKTYD